MAVSTARIPRLGLPLAYFLGYFLGDGYTSAAGNRIIGMSCHSIDEEHFCRMILVPLITKLFGIRPSVHKKNQNAFAITFVSKKVLSYLTSEISIPLGQAKKTVPGWVAQSSMKTKVAFIRGLFDADGSLIFSRKTYPKEIYPSLELKSVDHDILEWVAGVLLELGFRVSLGRSVEIWVLRINGREMLTRWMKKIGTENLKHTSKYEVWQRLGYCPSGTTVPERLRLLRRRRTGIGKANIE